MPTALVNDVTDTALWVAVYRATETERRDALFRDPLAGRLAGERGRQIAAGMSGGRYTEWSVVIRTRVIDSFVQELITQGIDTVMNLGAGLDTRPYRLDLPAALRWIEADLPQIIDLKEARLGGEKPACRLERIRVDLADESARKSLFSRVGGESRRVLILTEGVAPYLSNEQVATLARGLREQEAFRYWIVDYFSPQIIQYMRSKRGKQMRNAPFRFDPGDFFEFFARQGWRAQETRYLGEESEKLGRSIPLPWWATLMLFLVRSPERNNAFRKALAYVLLEPAPPH